MKRTSFNSALCFLILLAPVSFLTAYMSWHLLLLIHLGLPLSFARWFYAFGTARNTLGLIALAATITLWVIGIGAYVKNRRMEKALGQVLLKNAYPRAA